jgi:hypothetical protein
MRSLGLEVHTDETRSGNGQQEEKVESFHRDWMNGFRDQVGIGIKCEKRQQEIRVGSFHAAVS